MSHKMNDERDDNIRDGRYENEVISEGGNMTTDEELQFNTQQQESWGQLFSHSNLASLGTDIEDAINVPDALRIAGLDWEVEKNPTFYTRDDDDGMAFIKSKQFYSISRTDTKDEFCHATSRYQTVNNADAFGFVDLLCEEGARFWRAGEFRGGRKVFMIVKLPVPLTMSSGDTIARSIIVSTSHDSTQGIRANWLPIRFACSNVIAATIANSPMVFRHTLSMADGVNAKTARRILYDAEHYYSSLDRYVNAMEVQPFNDGDMEKLIENVFDAPRTPDDKNRLSNNYLYDTCLQTFRRGRGTFGLTKWDAYNAICEYLDYYRPIGNKLDSVANPAMQNERHFNSILSTNRFSGTKLRTKAFGLLTA